MPTPRPNDETESEWMQRCVPMVMDDGSAQNNDQAVAMCMQMWRDAKNPNSGKMKYRLDFALEVKALGPREFEGHGSVFNNIDLGGDIVLPGAFKRSLANHRKLGTFPAMFWMHKMDQVPGVWTEIREDEKGLYVKGELVDTVLGNEMRTLLQKKAVRGASIGYETLDYDFDADGNRLLKEVALWEVSIVSLAMNPLARIETVKSRLSGQGVYVPTPREFEEFLLNPHASALRFSKSASRYITAKVFGRSGGMLDDQSLDDETGGMPDAHRLDAGDVDPAAAEVLKALAKTTDEFWSEVFRR